MPLSNSAGRDRFTLPEVMMVTFIFGLIMTAALGIYTTAAREWTDTSLTLDTSHDANMIMERIVYGYANNLGLRSIEKLTVTQAVSAAGWSLRYETPSSDTNHVQDLEYSHALRQIRYRNTSMGSTWAVLGNNVTDSTIANSGDGLTLSLTVDQKAGKFSSQVSLSTFVLFRN
jgi:prepilin-type N-terminal cleavage/methylation domain-containing protein